MAGWIKLYRKIRECSIWKQKPFDRTHAWIDILLSANHESKEVLLGNEVIHVERGSFITSESKLMERWGWSKSKVRAFLHMLESQQMIVKKTDHKKTIINVVNYSFYQDGETTEKPPKDHQQTTKRPLKDPNKNIKNDEEYKEEYIYNTPKDEAQTVEQISLIETTEKEKKILKVFKSVPNYPFNYKRDLEFIRTLSVQYPELDILAESEKWRIYKLDKPLQKNSNPRSQFRNWCEIASGKQRERSKLNGKPTTNIKPLTTRTLEDYKRSYADW